MEGGKMKMKNYILMTAILVTGACVYASGQSKPTASTDKLVLLGRAGPAVCGIDRVYIVIDRPDRGRMSKNRLWQSLRTKVTGEIRDAGIKIIPSDKTGTAARLEIPEFHIRIQTIDYNDTSQCVLFIRSFLTRRVYLTADRSTAIKAEVWQTKPILQVVSTDDCITEISKIVLQNARAFAHSLITAKPEKLSAGAFVASKNSKIFHKAGCPFAKRISPDNLVTYRTRDDAIKAGKRPCRRCKP